MFDTIAIYPWIFIFWPYRFYIIVVYGICSDRTVVSYVVLALWKSFLAQVIYSVFVGDVTMEAENVIISACPEIILALAVNLREFHAIDLNVI